MGQFASIDLERAAVGRTVLEALLGQASPDELPGVIDHFLSKTTGYDPVLVQACLASLAERAQADWLPPRLASSSAWNNTPNGSWLVARLLEMRGQRQLAENAFAQIA